MTLSPDDRRKLIGLLGRLGSDSAGERDNAAVAIERIRVQAGFVWDEMIGVVLPTGYDVNARASSPRTGRPREWSAPERKPDLREWRKGSDEPSTGRTKAKKWFPKEPDYKAAIDAAMLGCTTAAETSVVLPLETMRRDYGINAFLSEKQAEWLMALAAKARV